MKDELEGFDPSQGWSMDNHPRLFHGTSTILLGSIRKEGLRPGSCWGTERVARYFADRNRDEHGGDRMVLSVLSSDIDFAALIADEQMIDFPIFPDYDLRQLEWERDDCSQDWRECLRLYESVVDTFGTPWSRIMTV